MKFNVLIQQPPIPVFHMHTGEIIDHRSNFLKIKDVTVEADDAEVALCKANARYPQFKGRLAVNETRSRH